MHRLITLIADIDGAPGQLQIAVCHNMNELILFGVLVNLLGNLDGCVYITVSSSPPDRLEVNWNCAEAIRTISVYGQDPKDHKSARPLTQVTTADYPEGFCKTNVTFDAEPFPGGWSRTSKGRRDPKSHCLYWTVAYFQGRVTSYDCYRIRPGWMAENRRELRNLSLPFLFLPGTHNSGTDVMKTRRRRSVSQLEDLVLTQDQSVWNQLVYGIRFLDFRVGYYPNEEEPSLRFWINHDMLRVQPLLPVLNDILHFSTSSPDEVIVLDFHRFPAGFRSKNAPLVHKELLHLLYTHFRDRLIPRPPTQSSLTLGDIWRSDRRIVVSYSEDSLVAETPWLWGSVSQRWGNKQTAEGLERFLDSTFRDVGPGKLWAAMAELTPTPLDFLGDGSLRVMAERVNRKLSGWFSERKNWTSRANVVATDYFRGTNLIQLAIEENVRRGKELEERKHVLSCQTQIVIPKT